MNVIERLRKQATGKTIRAALYARFSSNNQREESIDAQKRAINDFADVNGIVIVAEYLDYAKSATTDDRPQFQQMIKDSEKGDFQLVLVHKMDRFSRRVEDNLTYRAILKQNHTELLSVLEPFATADDAPESKLLNLILAGMSEFYIGNLSREVMKGLVENALKAKHTGGTPPLGYDIDRNTLMLVINEQEAEAVKMIFDLILYGHSYDDIIKQLNEKGYKTKAGNPFGKNSLYEILRNPKYKGVYVYKRSTSANPYTKKRNTHKRNNPEDMIIVEGGVPAIISEEDFDKVQELMENRRQHFRGGQEHHEQYLLTGKIVCGKCGHTYTGNRKKSKGKKPPNITYRCNNQARRTGIVCNNREVNRDYLETFVLEQIEQSIFNERMADVILTQFESYLRDKDKEMNQTIRRLEEQVKQKDTERSKWVKAIAESETSHQRQIAMKEMERIDDEKADLQKRIEKEKEAIELNIPDRSELQECYQKAQEMFRTRKLTNMKTLIDLYVEKVIVHEDEVEVILNLVPLLYRQKFTDAVWRISRELLRGKYRHYVLLVLSVVDMLLS